MYKVYVLVCPNGKKYYGTTKQENPNKRWFCGNGYTTNEPLFEDITDYGWINFTHEVIKEFETKEEAHLYEGYCILNDKTYISEFGYNTHINKYTVSNNYKRAYLCEEDGKVYTTLKDAAGLCKRSISAVSKAIAAHRQCGEHTFKKIWISKITGEMVSPEINKLLSIYEEEI